MIKHSAEADSEKVHKLLQEYNQQFWQDLRDYNFHIEEDHKIVAGIVAGSSFKTLEVEFLFVDKNHRGKGYGHQLLHYAEEKAKSDGLGQVLLNTYSFQATGFYEKEGYELLLQIEHAFGEFSQYIFRKKL